MSELAVEPEITSGEEIGAGETPVVETGAAETPAVETPAPVTPDWDNVEVLREAAARLQAMGYDITPAQRQALEAETTEYDPYDPASLVSVLEKSPLGQAVAQLMAAEQARQSENVDTQVNTAIASVRTELGYTDTSVPDTHIYALGNQLAAEATKGLPDYVIAQKGEQIARDSIKQAVEFFQARDKTRDEAAVQAYRDSLTEGGGNLLDPAVRTGGVPAGTEPTDEMDAARRFTWTAS